MLLRYTRSIYQNISKRSLKTKAVHQHEIDNAWQVSKYEVFSGPYFPLFGMNTEIYGVQENVDQKKLRI